MDNGSKGACRDSTGTARKELMPPCVCDRMSYLLTHTYRLVREFLSAGCQEQRPSVT